MELINKINSLNNEVKKLNNERNIALGKKETLTQQLNQGIADYNAKFQTNISADTVEAELTKVTTEVQAKATKLEEAITQIKSGNYTEANSTLDIKPVVPVAETPAPAELTTAPTTVHSAPVAPVVPEAPVQQSAPVQPDAPVAPVMPSTPSEPERPAPAERPAPDAASFLDMLNLAPGEVPAQSSTPTATVGGGMSFAAKVEAVAEPSAPVASSTPVAPAAPSAPAEPKVGLPPTNFTTFMGV